MTEMNAAMFYAPMDVRFERTEVPVAGPGELLVNVRAALTCGTDIKTYQRGHPVIIPKVPSTFGHEYSGEVVQVGEGVEGIESGDRVTACNAVPCYECYYCKIGKNSLCENLLIVNGAYAEYIVVPERMVKHNVYKLPENMTYEEAALSEPLGTAVHAIRYAKIDMGDTVAVVGSGPLGLMLARLSHLQGAKVILLGKGAERLNTATEFGVNEIIDITEIPDPAGRIQAVKGLTGRGRGADVVIEAVGKPEAWEEALQMGRKAAKIVFFGGCSKGTTITVDTFLLHYTELTLYGVFHQTPDDYKRACDLLADRLVDGRKFVKESLPLSQLIEAFDRVKALEAIKYAIDPTVMG
jgi:L-iditol 2-dehydrogenase